MGIHNQKTTTKVLEIDSVDNYVNQKANVIEDKDVQQKIAQMNAPQPKFDIQSAQPLKTIPQLSTNRSARYQRPLTDAERGEATADYFTGKPGTMEKERRAVDSPEVQTGISTLLGGGPSEGLKPIKRNPLRQGMTSKT